MSWGLKVQPVTKRQLSLQKNKTNFDRKSRIFSRREKRQNRKACWKDSKLVFLTNNNVYVLIIRLIRTVITDAKTRSNTSSSNNKTIIIKDNNNKPNNNNNSNDTDEKEVKITNGRRDEKSIANIDAEEQRVQKIISLGHSWDAAARGTDGPKWTDKSGGVWNKETKARIRWLTEINWQQRRRVKQRNKRARNVDWLKLSAKRCERWQKRGTLTEKNWQKRWMLTKNNWQKRWMSTENNWQ